MAALCSVVSDDEKYRPPESAARKISPSDGHISIILFFLHQHDRQCVSVNVFLWGPYYKSCCCLSVLEPAACHVGQYWFW